MRRLLLPAVIMPVLMVAATMPALAQKGGGGGGPSHTSVTPDFGSTSAWAATSGNNVTFTVANTSGDWEAYNLACTPATPVNSCTPSVGSVQVGPNSSVNVSVSFATAASVGTGGVTLTATSWYIPPCEEFECPPEEDTGHYNVTVTAGPPPTVSLAISSFDRRSYGQCLASCFAATYAQGTVPYVSMDTPRNVTLAYNSDRTTLRPFVHADVAHGHPAYAPTEYRFQVKVDGALATFLNGQQTLVFSYPGAAWHRIGGQFDATSYVTGVRHLEVLVTSVFPDSSTLTTSTTSRLAVLDERNSYVARGWTIAGLQRIHTQADTVILIAEGDGSHTTFVKVGSVYQRPPGDVTKLEVFASSEKFVRTYPDSTKAIFNLAGQLIKVRDRFGNETQFAYDAQGRLWYVQENGRWTQLLYDANGLASIKDPFNRYTYVTVDASRRLTAIQDPDAVSTTFGYDGQLRLSTVTDRRGHTSTYLYNDTTQLLAGVRSPPVPVYGAGTPQLTTSFDPWQRDGVPYVSTSSGSPFAPVDVNQVDALVIAPDGRQVRYRAFNGLGLASYEELPYGNVIVRAYNALGQVVSVIDPFGPDGTYQYDEWGKVTYASEEGRERHITYNPGDWSLPDSIWGDGVVGQKLFVSAGKVDAIRYGAFAGQDVADMTYHYFWYDALGRVTKTRDALHLLRETWYTGTNGNRSKDSMPGSRTVAFGYDVYGRPVWTERAGFPRDSVKYDTVNRPIRTYDGVHATPTVLDYDSLYLTSVTDAKGQVHGFGYDATGALITRTDPAGKSEQYAYGWNRELRAYTNRRDETVTFAYDSLLRRTIRAGTNFATDSLRYSPDGLTVTGFSAVSVDSAIANEFGQPEKVRSVFAAFPSQQYWRNYSYNPDQRLFKVMSGPGVSFTTRMYGWWGNGRLFEIDLGGEKTRFRYNPDLQADTLLLPDGSTIRQQFTSTHVLASRTVNVAYGSTTDRWLSVDDLNRITHQERSGNKVHRYVYDDLSRLVRDTAFTWTTPVCGFQEGYGFVCTGGQSIDSTRSFSYDSVGNRTDHGGAYGTANRIEVFDGCTYGTDFDGNVTSRTCGGTTTTFEWDALNRLVEFTVGATTVNLQYNAFDQLAYRSAGSMPQGAEYYLWDRSNLFAILNGSGTVRAEYSYYPGLDRLHAIKAGGVSYYAHNDAAGNVIALTNTSAQLKRTYTYDNWGKAGSGSDLAGLANVDRARFKGALWLGQELDVYYMRNRWYEPGTGRFLSEDPIGLAGGINLYTFGGGDPINLRDPRGLEADSSSDDEVADWRNICPFGGVYNFDTGICDRQNDESYNSAEARGFVGAAEAAGYTVFVSGALYANGPYVAPDLVERGWFTLDFTDRHGHLVIFNLTNVLFEKVRTVRDTDRWVDAIYRIVGWDSQSANMPNTVLLYANRVPIRSTLRELAPGNYTGGFFQHGRAGGRWHHP